MNKFLNEAFILKSRLTSIPGVSLFLLFVALPFANVFAEDPFIPESDETVLVVLPKSLLVDRDAMRKLRNQLAADPTNENLASTVAQRYISIGKRGGDPRFFGYAQAAISHWWEDDSAPAEILKLRAKLKENEHQFDAAVVDLELALKQKPNDAQLLLELANILRVQGKFDEALAIGDQLEESSGTLSATLCRAPIFIMTGRANEARELLDNILPAAKANYPSTLGWIATVQVDVALALGKDDEVEKYFREGLISNPDDVQLLRRYSDFLLDRNQNEKALDLLRDHVADNGVLLRAAIAAKRCGDSSATDWSNQLEQRFDEIRLRGSEPHGRFESRFALQVKDDPERAFQLAAKNWTRQKEVRDARNFMEAAIANRDFGGSTSVLDFLQRNGTKHALLDPLVEKLRSTQ